MPPPTPPIVNDGPDDRREARVLDQHERLLERLGHAAARHLDADLRHRIAKQQPILRHANGLDRGANQLHAVLGEDAALVQRDREVQRRLPADGRQHRIRPLDGDDRLHGLGRQRLDVGPIRHLGVGHDRRRVAVHQHDLEAFTAQRLARLRPE
jgi:hypothetical protein